MLHGVARDHASCRYRGAVLNRSLTSPVRRCHLSSLRNFRSADVTNGLATRRGSALCRCASTSGRERLQSACAPVETVTSHALLSKLGISPVRLALAAAALASQGSSLSGLSLSLLGLWIGPCRFVLPSGVPDVSFMFTRRHQSSRKAPQLLDAASTAAGDNVQRDKQKTGKSASKNGGERSEAAVMKDAMQNVMEAMTELPNVKAPASVWLPHKATSLLTKRATPPPTQPPELKPGVPRSQSLLGRLFRMASVLAKLPAYIVAYIAFKVQQVMLGSTWSKLAAVFIAGLPLCVVGGGLYSLASGKSLVDGFIQAYGALYKIPGVTVIGEINVWTAHLMNILWLVGTFTFAIVLGVITEDIVSTVMTIRTGNYDIVAQNHTLILNWNDQTMPLLRQIAVNKGERGHGAYSGPVVVMADRSKEAMDKELRSALRGLRLEWHARAGAPHSKTDLERVAAGQARTVILLHPQDAEDAGKKQVATILGVLTARAATRPRPLLKLKPQHIAVQSPEGSEDSKVLEAAEAIIAASPQKFRLTALSGRKDMSALLAHTAVQPGVASVYCTVVQQTRGGVEFYIRSFEGLEGLTFREVRRAFNSAVICGYERLEGRHMLLNPSDDDILAKGDRLVALAQTGFFKPTLPGVAAKPSDGVAEEVAESDIAPTAAPSGDARDAGHGNAAKSGDDRAPKRIVVAWQDGDISDLARSLAVFAPRGSTVSVLSTEKPEEQATTRASAQGRHQKDAPVLPSLREFVAKYWAGAALKAMLPGQGFPEKEGLLAKVSFRHEAGSPTSLEMLRRVGTAQAQAIVIGGTALHQDPKDADAFTLTVIMLIQEVMAAAGRKRASTAHIAALVYENETVEVANFLIDRLGRDSVTAELLQPDELVSGIVAQVAAEPDMATLLSSFIYSDAGQEIFLRLPGYFNITDAAETPFSMVAELARERKEIAIGLISQDGNMELVPETKATHVYKPNDRIVVLADQEKAESLFPRLAVA